MDPEPETAKQLDRIAGVLERLSTPPTADSSILGRFRSAVKTISSSWPLFLFTLSIIGAALGWAIFGISPLQPLEEVANRQREYRERREQTLLIKRMVGRHIELGNAFLGLGQFEAARMEFQQALARDPGTADAHIGFLKTEVFQSLRERYYRPDIIRERLRMLLRENPRDAHALLLLGRVFAGQASGLEISQDSALAYYKQALDADSGLADAYEGVGMIYFSRDQHDSAVRALKKAVDLSPWNPGYLDNLAYYDYTDGRPQQAVEHYSLILRLDPDYLSAYYTLAHAYRMVGRLRTAEGLLEDLDEHLRDSTLMAMDKNKSCLLWRLRFDTLRTAEAQTCTVAEKRAYARFTKLRRST